MKEKMIRMYNNTKNGVQKHSPEILAGVGVVGVVASTVMACKATMKLNDILEESKETRDKIREVESNPRYEEQYSHEDAKKDLTINYTAAAQSVGRVAGGYGYLRGCGYRCRWRVGNLDGGTYPHYYHTVAADDLVEEGAQLG